MADNLGYQGTAGYPPAGRPLPGAYMPQEASSHSTASYHDGGYPPSTGIGYPQAGGYPPPQAGGFPPSQAGGYPPQTGGPPPPPGPTSQPITAWQPNEGIKYQGSDIPTDLLGEDHQGVEPTAPPLGPPPAFTGYEVKTRFSEAYCRH